MSSFQIHFHHNNIKKTGIYRLYVQYIHVLNYVLPISLGVTVFDNNPQLHSFFKKCVLPSAAINALVNVFF